MEARPLIVIVGPTASGKTALAIEIARQVGGEIICADSRTIYKSMDIGTAKPSKEEQQIVPHWGLDLVEPDEYFSAADFKQYATDKIKDIRNRGKVPLLVGGTGLYIDAILFDFQFGPPPDMHLRQQFERMSIEELYNYCNKNNIKLPENYKNKRYVIRAIEQKSSTQQRSSAPLDNTIIVGIATNKDELRARIALRAEDLVSDSVVDEARSLGTRFGWEHQSLTGNIYPLCRQYMENVITFDELKRKFITLDWRLAKRQMTWFKRNPFIRWCSLSEAKEYIVRSLESEH